MEQPLDGVRLKLLRVEHHLKQLDKWTREFLHSDFYDIGAEIDAKERIVYRVTRADPTPAKWGILIGEVLYNLRSALDHLAFELAVLELGRPLPRDIEKSSAFPLMDSGPSFRRRQVKGSKKGQPTNDSGLHKIRGMSRRAQTTVERLQPYHRRKRPELGPLLWLERLCNVDKHRSLHVTTAGSVRVQYGLGGTGIGTIHTPPETFRRPLVPNAMLARVTVEWIPGVERNVNVELEHIADVMFEQGVIARAAIRQSVMDTLYACRYAVSAVVVPELMPLFPAANRLRVTEVRRDKSEGPRSRTHVVRGLIQG